MNISEVYLKYMFVKIEIYILFKSIDLDNNFESTISTEIEF